MKTTAGGELLDDRQEVVLAHDHEFFAVDLDSGAGVGGEDDLVALLDAPGGALAGLQALAVAERDDLAAARFFLCRGGQDDAGLGLSLGLDAPNKDFIAERTKLCHVCHCY